MERKAGIAKLFAETGDRTPAPSVKIAKVKIIFFILFFAVKIRRFSLSTFVYEEIRLTQRYVTAGFMLLFMLMANGFLELALVILVAAILGIVFKALKQPVILAYLATGALIGYLGFFNLANRETFKIFADLGIMFLLFMVGLQINYRSLKLVGKPSLIVGLGQMVFTAAIGFFLATFFHFNYLESVYIAVALTFSSTIIVVKLLSDKKDLNSLYGKISVGFLLAQDLVAILILVLLAGFQNGGALNWLSIILTFLKGVILFVLMFWLGRKFLPFVFSKIARSDELVFLTSLAWVFLLAALASRVGFSIEIAGFLAGLALANSSEHFQIASRFRSLRDFFILIFFVILGSSIIFSNFRGLTLPILVFSLFVLVGNPLIVLIIMGLLGYRKRTSFLAGVTVAQISEFSLILAALGFKIGHIKENVLALITAVGIITITLSTYLIVYAENIFSRARRFLSLFERRKLKEELSREIFSKKEVILIGCHRTGESIALSIPKEKLLIIDFDPEVINFLKKHGYDYIFGDIRETRVFENAGFEEALLVISTSPDFEDNLFLLTALRNRKNRPKVILRAETEKETEILYREGADYVLLPNFTAGQYLGKTIAIDPTMEILPDLKRRDLALIRKMAIEE